MKKVLLITNGIFHPPLLGCLNLRKSISRLVDYQFHNLSSMERLPENLNDYSVMVIYFHHNKISDLALNKFDDFVVNGGGVLAIHSATASFKKTDRFTDILGGKFIGHGPVETFVVTPVAPESHIFHGIPEFQVSDELYIHDLQPDIETHFTALHDEVQVPMVWTRNHGSGRVCYTCPGHKSAVFKNPEYQQVLIRGLKWVAGKNI